MKCKTRPSVPKSPARRVILSAIAALSISFLGAALSTTPAQADPVQPPAQDHPVSLDVDLGGSLTLDSGTTGQGRDVTIQDFDPVARSSGTVLRWSSPDSWLIWPKVTASWRIVEDGTATNYFVKVHKDDKNQSCDILTVGPGGKQVPVDAANSVYACSVSGGSIYFSSTMTLHLVPVVWSSVAGSLSAEGSVGLDQGQQTSRNARFFVSDSLHKPTDPVANINPGQTTSWSAEMRNGEGATADDGARTDFSYRILDDGEPTKYYAKGFMQNVKSLAGYKYTYECHIYFHDPDHGGTETEYSPYTCDYDATESGYSDSHLAAYFNVKAR